MSFIASAVVGFGAAALGASASTAIGLGIGAGSLVSGSRAAKTQAQAQSQASEQSLQAAREQLAATQPLRDLALQQGQFQFGQQQRLLPSLIDQQLAGIPQQQAFAQAAQRALPLLTQDINRQAGTGQPFQRRLEQGTRNIFSSLSPFGLSDSSVAGRAVGDLQSGLLGQDIENLQNQRFRLAGFQSFPQAPGTPSFAGFGTAGLGTAAQLQSTGISQQLGAGQTRAAGQLGFGNTLAQLPLLQAFNTTITQPPTAPGIAQTPGFFGPGF